MKFIIIIGCLWSCAQGNYTPPAKESFCENIYCSRKDHMICDEFIPEHNGFLGREPVKIDLTSAQKAVILNTHNELRNIIACGEPKLTNLAGETFPAANNMNELVWNEELEWAAGLNAATCASNHDCSATPTFNLAGQNLAMSASSGKINSTEYVKSSVLAWFAEYLNTPITVVDGYSGELVKDVSELSTEEHEKIRGLVENAYLIAKNGHFTALVKDTSSKIGCALYSCGAVDENMRNSIYFVCNYEMTNIFSDPTYHHDGDSSCEKSTKFCCLCSEKNQQDNETMSCLKSDLKVPFFESQVMSTTEAGGLEKTSKVPIVVTKIPEALDNKTESLKHTLFNNISNLYNFYGNVSFNINIFNLFGSSSKETKKND